MSDLVGPSDAPSFATAEKVEVEKLDYETPTEAKLMEEIEENFNRDSGNDISGTEF